MIEIDKGSMRSHRNIDDYTLYICDRCKRQCALLTKETHSPPYCPFLEFENDNSPYIFKY